MRTVTVRLGVLATLPLVFAAAAGATATGAVAARAPEGGIRETLFVFAGVTDDGEQGSPSARVATSVHCSNFSPTAASIEVVVRDEEGTLYSAVTAIQPSRTLTFSTQGTAVYFDDVLMAPGGGTARIAQGSGEVLADSSQLVCTAQVLDPNGEPPAFVVGLPLEKPLTIFADGFESGDTSAWDATVP